MKLHEIIAHNENPKTEILIESMAPYFKSLRTYYEAYYCQECVLMVTTVFNAAQYGKIVPANEFSEAIDEYTDDEDEKELINFQSQMLNNIIKGMEANK